MSKKLNKSYVFFKNLFRPVGEVSVPEGKKLTIFHKAVVCYASKPLQFKDIPNTISFYEWERVKERIEFKKKLLFSTIFMVLYWYFVLRPIGINRQRWIEEQEIKKFGEVRSYEDFK